MSDVVTQTVSSLSLKPGDIILLDKFTSPSITLVISIVDDELRGSRYITILHPFLGVVVYRIFTKFITSKLIQRGT
jgi:hypothetical protein